MGTTSHELSLESGKKGTQRGHKGDTKAQTSLGRDTILFWKQRVRQRRNPNGKLIPDFQVRMKFRNREAWFNLSTQNRDAAASKARTIYRFLVANGWEATLDRYKPKTAEKLKSPTVGQFLGEIEVRAGLRAATYGDYARKFRRLVAGIVRIEGGPQKHDYHHGGHKEWLEKVHAVKLDRITPDAIQAWKVRFLREREADPLAAKRARVTFNSILRCSKSLFSKKVRKFIQINLPLDDPFHEVEFAKVGKGRYRSGIEAAGLMAAAREELGVEVPSIVLDGSKNLKRSIADAKERREQFKVFLLALGAGLRRGEIDQLTWKQVDPQKGIIRLETTEHGELKSAGSEEDVDVDPELLTLLQQFRNSRVDSAFVVLEKTPARKVNSQRYYRCERIFVKLTAWLRTKGITSQSPIHTLRKEFGSIVNQQYGIFAASSQLRHSSITLTREVYTGKKARFAPKFDQEEPQQSTQEPDNGEPVPTDQ